MVRVRSPLWRLKKRCHIAVSHNFGVIADLEQKRSKNTLQLLDISHERD